MGHRSRARAREEIERRIVRCELPGGTLVDEQALVAELDVPEGAVREALAALECDGFVHCAGHDGWSVAPLDELELRETYPIVLLLEGLAVRTTEHDAASIARLRAVNDAMADASEDALAAATQDHAFHEELVRGCANEQLLGTLRPLKRLLLRYEYAYMSDAINVGASVRQHATIIDLLERGDSDAAARAVQDNFRAALPGVLERL